MLKSPIFYMRRSDFNSDGSLKSDFLSKNNRMLIIFIHAAYCMHCHNAAPEFQRAAENNTDKNIFFAGIQADGDVDGEVSSESIFPKILEKFMGYPDYAVFYNGKPTHLVISARDEKSILDQLYRYKNSVG